MKVQIVSLTAVVLGGWLTLAGPASAQDTNATARAQRRGPAMQQRVERMTTALELNPDQQAKVKALLQKQAKARRDLRDLPREQRRDKVRALTQEQNKELKAILTPDQFEKWKKVRQEMRPRRAGNAEQPGGGAAAPAPEPKNPENKAQ